MWCLKSRELSASGSKEVVKEVRETLSTRLLGTITGSEMEESWARRTWEASTSLVVSSWQPARKEGHHPTTPKSCIWPKTQMSLKVDSSPSSRKYPRPSDSLILISLVKETLREGPSWARVYLDFSVFQNCEIIDLAPKFMVIF